MLHFRTLALWLLATAPWLVQAQLSEDFSDGNITDAPAWQGDLSDFLVNPELQLQLNAPAAGTSAIHIPTTIADSAVWEIYFKMDFPPSTSNSLKLVLQSDQPDLATANGYYLFIGETGNDDAIQFYRTEGGAVTLLATATVGAVSNSPEVRIRMERLTGGAWNLSADYTGGHNFGQEFSLIDDQFGGGNLYFGIECNYTATRVDKFFFDDLSIQPYLPDLSPPGILSAMPISSSEVDLYFDEPVAEPSATEPDNYSINNGIGPPAAAFLDSSDKTLVHLSLQNPLANMADYVLTANNIDDLVGNIAPSQTVSFSFLETEPASEFDILINEVMADPTPPVGLPSVEFIELLNRSDKVIDLEGMAFSSGGTPQLFPAHLIEPGTFVLVCDEQDVDSLTAFGDVVGLSTFPSLVNSGDELSLTGPTGNIVHRVIYSLLTYGDPQKEEGGWTLELINPSAPCLGESNWRASVSLLGGTPGQPNSVLDETPDSVGPNLLRAFADATQPSTIELSFDESLDKSTAETASNYSISNTAGISSATLLPPSNNVVRLQLATPLQPSVLYEIMVSDQVADCSGNTLAGNSAALALPEPIDPLDIVINEILFNPETGGVDFVEVFNRSEKVLDLGGLVIANIQEGVDTVARQIDANQLLFPGGYSVFTVSPNDILSRYFVENEAALIKNDLPAFNNDAGNVTLFRSSPTGAVIIDDFDYNEDFHHPLLDKTDGVSLERISPEAPTQDRNNWQSAAGTVGYATPTFKNSQAVSPLSPATANIEIAEKKLSPDGDGFQDFLLVNYHTDTPGFTAQAKIFDAEGRLVKTLFNNKTFSTNGFFRWDGDTDRGGRARIGIYILWVQLFHPDGTVKTFKETCVVAGRL